MLAGTPAITNAELAGARAAVDPAGPSADGIMDAHHLAIVVDDRILSIPYINWRMNPDGIDGAQGTQISGLTAETARQLAAILSASPLPGPVGP